MANHPHPPWDPQFLIWCRSRRQWWCQNEHGYTSSIVDAGRFSAPQMSAIMIRSRIEGDDFPIPAEFAEVIHELVRVEVAAHRRGMLTLHG